MSDLIEHNWSNQVIDVTDAPGKPALPPGYTQVSIEVIKQGEYICYGGMHVSADDSSPVRGGLIVRDAPLELGAKLLPYLVAPTGQTVRVAIVSAS